MSNAAEVHIEGLPFTWTENDLQKYFEKCGDIKAVRMPTWNDSGRSKGYGFVTFASSEAVEEALKLNKSKVDGRWLNVALSRGESAPGEASAAKGVQFSSTPEEGCSTVFIKNLPYEVTEDQIGELFTSFGKVDSVRIATDQGRVKGFCYVEFADANIVEKIATETKGGKTWELGGRALHLDYGKGAPRAGFHPRAEAFESKFGGTPVKKSFGGIERGGKGGFGKGKGKGFGKGKGKGFGGKGKGKGKGFGKGKGKGFGKGKGRGSRDD